MKRRRRAIGVLTLWVAAVSCASPPTSPGDERTLTPVADSAEWPASTPAAQAVDAGKLQDLVTRIARGDYGAITSLLIVRHDRLLLEEYFRSWTASQPHTMQSVSKSVTSLITGIAVDQKRLTVSDRVTTFFPNYDPIANFDDRKAQQTVRDLLTMQTGFDWSEAIYAGSPLQRLNTCQCDWLRFVLDWPMREPPGTRWEYVSGGVILLGGVVGAATGQRIDRFAETNLFAPLGVQGAYWVGGLPDGLPHTGGGLYLRPRDMAKIGQLVLGAGVWRGVRIVSESWIQESTTPVKFAVRTFASRSTDYGYLWWRMDGPTIVAAGAQGQWIFVVPNADLVAVATGEYDANFESAVNFFYGYILPAAR